MRTRSFPTTSQHAGGPVKSQQTRLAVLVSFTSRRAAPRNSFRVAPGCKLSRDVRGEEKKRCANNNVGVTSRIRPLFSGGEELKGKKTATNLQRCCFSQSFRTAAELARPPAGNRGRRQGSNDEYLLKRRVEDLCIHLLQWPLY